MIKSNKIKVFLIHYSILEKRYNYLSKILLSNQFDQIWITENDIVSEKVVSKSSNKVLGVNFKLVGMDLGINSRSLVFSRRKARFQGWILLMRSILQRDDSLILGSMSNTTRQSDALLEVSKMHLRAIRSGINSSSEWILILEDDAIPELTFHDSLKWVHNKFDSKKKIWINLNSGASLRHTQSDPKPDLMGFYRVKPAVTRCVVAYMISKPLAIEIISRIEKYGLPDWLPIDVVIQVILRGSNAHSYWQDPASVIQGSESGNYGSNLRA